MIKLIHVLVAAVIVMAIATHSNAIMLDVGSISVSGDPGVRANDLSRYWVFFGDLDKEAFIDYSRNDIINNVNQVVRLNERINGLVSQLYNHDKTGLAGSELRFFDIYKDKIRLGAQLYTQDRFTGGANVYDFHFPDLTEYTFKGLYGLTRFTETNSTINIETKLFAEAEPVPEPSTLLLIGTGIATVVGYTRKRNRI